MQVKSLHIGENTRVTNNDIEAIMNKQELEELIIPINRLQDIPNITFSSGLTTLVLTGYVF